MKTSLSIPILQPVYIYRELHLPIKRRKRRNKHESVKDTNRRRPINHR
jgi:hypothetical protein